MLAHTALPLRDASSILNGDAGRHLAVRCAASVAVEVTRLRRIGPGPSVRAALLAFKNDILECEIPKVPVPEVKKHTIEIQG